MSVYNKERVKLTFLFVAFLLVTFVSINIIVTSILRSIRIERSLNHISNSQDQIISILNK